MRVIIAGGGTGGLAAAIALRRIGLEPLVLERAPAFTAIGAGLGLQANAMKAITHLGGDRLWREAGARIDEEEQRSLESGELIASWPIAVRAQRYGEHYYCGHRADLLGSLLEPLPEGSVRLGSRLVALEETPREMRIELEGGEELRCDLLIGADGLRSTTRRLLFAEAEARFTGVVVWRGLMATERMPERHRWRMLLWLGPRRHVLVYPLRHAHHPQSVHSLSAFVPMDEVQRESWTASGDLEDLRRSLGTACAEIHELLDCMDEALITGIYFRDPLERWCTPHAALLGDAAHPAPPNAGQGAGMALEDAVMLAACLRRHGPGGLRAALREYELRRAPRTIRMLESSRVNLLYSQVADPAGVRARNGYYRGLRRLSDIGSPMREWLLAHDPVAAAEDGANAPPEPAEPRARPQARRAFQAWSSALTLEHRCNGWRGERAGYEEFLRRELGADAGDPGERLDCAGVPCLRLGERGGIAVLHLHGGGFAMGSAAGARGLARRLAAALGGWALVPDYRLAPEHPFPAALEDALRAYRWLLERVPAERVVVSGECAGGALAVSLGTALARGGEPAPRAIHAVSPFCDVSISERGWSFAAARDPWFDRIFATQLAASYVQDEDPAGPLISPLFAELGGLPPLLVHAAADEALRPGAERLARRAAAAGVTTSFRAFPDSVHSFVLFGELEESAAALEELATFVATACAGGEV